MTSTQIGLVAVVAVAGVFLAGLVVVLVRARRQVAAGPGPAGAEAEALTRQVDELQRLLERAESRVEELRSLLAADLHAVAHAPGDPTADRREDQILLLQTEGLDEIGIARRLDMDVGEVQLVLNLHRSRQEHSLGPIAGQPRPDPLREES